MSPRGQRRPGEHIPRPRRKVPKTTKGSSGVRVVRLLLLAVIAVAAAVLAARYYGGAR